jgi:hypothetical protein
MDSASRIVDGFGINRPDRVRAIGMPTHEQGVAPLRDTKTSL